MELQSLAPTPAETNNIMTGLKRLSYRLSKANTPQKYIAALQLAKLLVHNFPLKSKMVWKVIRDSQTANTVENITGFPGGEIGDGSMVFPNQNR